MSSPDKFEHSEERRLFYVSMTRSKEQTHYIANPNAASDFAEELESNKTNYKIRLLEIEMKLENALNVQMV